MQDQSVFPSNFGELLKTARKRKRITQQQLAQRLGVHPNTISAWELGAYLPAARGLVLELARHLSLDAAATRQLLEASLTALFPHWQVPFPRNPFFTGREHILKTLYARLGINQAGALTQSYALHGLAGVGKTQIALEYAYRYALEYSAIFWIEAETTERVVSSLVHIAEVLQLPLQQEQDHQRIVAAVQQWLSTHKHWLLIWDNVEDLELLQRFLPPTRQGAALITTRCTALGTLAQGMELEPMGREEALLFLLRRIKLLEPEAAGEQRQQFAVSMSTEYEAAEELVSALGGLPLALDQAGAYMEETGCSPSGYLHRYEQQRHQLLDRRGASAFDHPRSVAATLWLSCQRVTERHPAALELLRFCAFFSADAIPEELIVTNASRLGPVLGPVAADLSQFDQAITALLSFSLIQRQPEQPTLSMHRLVQAVLLDALTEAEQEQWNMRAIAALDAVFPEILPYTEHTAWKPCERLLPHALACLHRDGGDPESLVIASLAYKAAQYLRERGRYAEAEPLYQCALQIRERTLEENHSNVASSLHALAEAFREQGKYAQAEALYQRAFHIREQTLGPDHSHVAFSLTGLALLYWQEGKYGQAEPLFQRARQICEHALGPDHPLAASLFYYQAEICRERGKYEQGEPLFQRALQIWEHALGPDHPHVAFSLTGLAELYTKQGKYIQAESLYQRARQVWEHALGPDHPHVPFSLTGLASLYRQQGKHEQVEGLYQRARQIWEQALGPDHPYVAFSLTGLAGLYTELGKHEQAAEGLYRRARQIWEQALGPDHPHVAIALNGLANLFREQHKDVDAEVLYRGTLLIREQRLGRSHPETAQTLYDLALLRQQQGHLSQAISLAQRALSIRSQSLRDTHPKTVATRTLCAQLLQQQASGQQEVASERSAEEIADPYREDHSAEEVSPEIVNPSPSEKDPLQGFLRSCCQLHPQAWCRASDLWQAYEHWTQERQLRFPLSRRAFTAHLKAAGFRPDRTSTARIWRGIALVGHEP